MPRVRVVTDSGCDIPAALLQRLAIGVVPFTVQVGERTYQDRVNITPDQFYRRLTTGRQPVTVSAPTSADFQSAYLGLARTTNAIISVHSSSKLCDAYTASLVAKNTLSNHVRIVTVDSQSASLGLGFMVLAAAVAAQRGETLDQIVTLVRGMVLQTHVSYALETTEYMQRSPRFAKLCQAIGDTTDLRPLIQLEEGTFEISEKVRTRAKAIERMYEFAELFPHIEELGVLYSTTPADADGLVKRIDAVFPKEQVVVSQYGPVLGSILGPAALGVAAYEGRG
ncbi:MAG: DegV family protein [Chloroflexota bacterium]